MPLRPTTSRNSSRLSAALASLRAQEEQETLLGDDEERVDGDGGVTGNPDEEIFASDPHKDLPVYRTIHR